MYISMETQKKFKTELVVLRHFIPRQWLWRGVERAVPRMIPVITAIEWLKLFDGATSDSYREKCRHEFIAGISRSVVCLERWDGFAWVTMEMNERLRRDAMKAGVLPPRYDAMAPSYPYAID